MRPKYSKTIANISNECNNVQHIWIRYIKAHITNKLKDLSPTAYSDKEKKDFPFPAMIPIKNAKTK